MRGIVVIVAVMLGSCRESSIPVSHETAAPARLCAHTISLENKEDADRLVAVASEQIITEVLEQSLYVLRTESQLTLVDLGSSDACDAADLPVEIPIGTLPVSAAWVLPADVQRLAIRQQTFRANEEASRQCIVIAQLRPARGESSNIDQLYSFGTTAFQRVGLLDAQAESANGSTYLASGSSCETVLDVVTAASSGLDLGEQEIQTRVCDGVTLKSCGYPHRID